MSPGIYILTISLLPITALIVFAMKYASSYAAARARIAGENELKALIARNVEELSAIGAALKRVADEQAHQAQTLANVDSMLREVG